MTNLTILIVEDNPLNLELAHDLLEMSGYQVLTAKTAEKGIQLAQQHPDLILMDISLPGMDGLEATRILKEDPATRSIPIIILTAYAMSSDHEKARGVNCDGYLTKPIDIDCFVKRISELLSGD